MVSITAAVGGMGVAGVAAAGGPATDFVDDTVAAGLHYLQYEIIDPPDPRGLIYMSGGAAAGDYDGDGLVDLYVTRFEAPDSLFRNLGNGTFEDVTEAAGFTEPRLTSNGAAWGDVDNDGDLDLYVTAIFDTRFYLFINDGGVFTEEAVARGAAVASPDEHFGQSVTFGDYNQDGWLDIHTTEWRRDDLNPTSATPNARLLRNLGATAPGQFEDVTVAAGVDLEGYHPSGSFSFASRFADLDDDGWPDIAIAADFGTSRLFWNNRDGTFTDGTAAAGVGTDENGMGSALGDIDGDGRLDWFITSIYDEVCEGIDCPWGTTGNRLYRNMGNRVFEDMTDAAGVRNGDWGWGACFVDFDNDTDLDLAMTNGVDFLPDPRDEPYNDDPMRLWRNDGPAGMTEVAAASGVTDTGNGKGILQFDYDNDGDRDLFVVNNAGYPVLYRNDVGNQNGWLDVEARGWINTFGIGAKITVTPEPGEPARVRELNCGSHFLGQSQTAAHFGLGSGTAPVHEVTIEWPGTFTTQTFNDVPRNTTLVLQEPTPPVRLAINGEHPPFRTVMTTGDVRLTLDTATGAFSQSLSWYLAYQVPAGGAWIFLTPSGPSAIPAPTFDSTLFDADDLVITDTVFPAGASFVFGVFLVDAGKVVAFDYLQGVVPDVSTAAHAPATHPAPPSGSSLTAELEAMIGAGVQTGVRPALPVAPEPSAPATGTP